MKKKIFLIIMLIISIIFAATYLNKTFLTKQEYVITFGTIEEKEKWIKKTKGVKVTYNVKKDNFLMVKANKIKVIIMKKNKKIKKIELIKTIEVNSGTTNL